MNGGGKKWTSELKLFPEHIKDSFRKSKQNQERRLEHDQWVDLQRNNRT